MAKRPPFVPGGGFMPSADPPAGPPPPGNLQPARTLPGGAVLEPGNAPRGKPGAKAGKPNFKSRITKAGGMKSGGVVSAGQGSGTGRTQRSRG
jgi:hypothetical protein